MRSEFEYRCAHLKHELAALATHTHHEAQSAPIE